MLFLDGTKKMKNNLQFGDSGFSYGGADRFYSRLNARKQLSQFSGCIFVLFLFGQNKPRKRHAITIKMRIVSTHFLFSSY